MIRRICAPFGSQIATLAYFFRQDEQAEFLAQLTVITLFRFFDPPE